MGFRTIVVKNRCKLEYSLNFLVMRTQDVEKKILINEIESLIIQSTQVSITCALLSNLAENGINVMICDEKSNPSCELLQYNGTYDSRNKLISQSNINEDIKNKTWKKIVEMKIFQQSRVLKKVSPNDDANDLLDTYFKEVQDGDLTNREGHAAKVYFNTLFGKDFSRDKDCDINAFLDYGYTIILSAFNRVIRSCGYYPELGIHHIGKTNPFNLSCDLMEPLRPLVDNLALSSDIDLDNFKTKMINLLNEHVYFDGNEMYLENAIKSYVKNIMSAMISNDLENIKFINYEL